MLVRKGSILGSILLKRRTCTGREPISPNQIHRTCYGETMFTQTCAECLRNRFNHCTESKDNGHIPSTILWRCSRIFTYSVAHSLSNNRCMSTATLLDSCYQRDPHHETVHRQDTPFAKFSAFYFIPSELGYIRQLLNGVPPWRMAEAVHYVLVGSSDRPNYLVRLYELLSAVISSMHTSQVLSAAGWTTRRRGQQIYLPRIRGGNFLHRIVHPYFNDTSWHVNFLRIVSNQVRPTHS